MAMNTIIQQGRFTSDGTAKLLSIRSDVDWMQTWNYTEAGNAAADSAVSAFWFRGLAPNDGFLTMRDGAGTADILQTVAAAASGAGFTLLDTSNQQPGALTALTSISNAQPPLVTVASTAALNDGDVVRLINVTTGQQLGGIDFTIDVVNGTTFQLEYMTAIAAATTGFYRVIPFDPIFYPPRRYITKVTAAPQAIVSLSVTHNFTVGQAVRFSVGPLQGMTQLDGLIGNIVAIGQADADGDTNTITVDIDSSAFTAFAWPTSAQVVNGFTPAQVIPVGEDTAVALAQGANILGDATRNISYIGMRLAAGQAAPAGVDGDVIYWVAGKSFSVINE